MGLHFLMRKRKKKNQKKVDEKMKRMAKINQKKLNTYLKIIALVCVMIVLIKVLPGAFSRYRSEATSEQELEIAFFLFQSERVSQNLGLEDLVPSEEPYIYAFQVENSDGTKRSEVNIEYKIQLRTTTNLPLEYKLFKNQNYDETDAKDIFISHILKKDDNGTYFNEYETEMQQLSHENDMKDIFYIAVYFPQSADSYWYENIIDSVEIAIDAQEVI